MLFRSYDVLTLVIRTFGLALYKIINCNAAYIANVGLDVVDSNFYKGQVTIDTNIPDRTGYEMQDKISDNASRFAMLFCKDSDALLNSTYIYRSIGEIIYGWLQIIRPVKDMTYEPIFILFANFMDTKVAVDMLPIKNKWPLYLAGGVLQLAREYKLHTAKFHPQYNPPVNK